MTRLISLVLAVSTVGLCFADDGDDTLQFYLTKSDLVVIGKIATLDVEGISEAGVPHYGGKFAIADVVKGDAGVKSKTIAVTIARFEMNKKDKHPLLKNGGECILFLKQVGTWKKIGKIFLKLLRKKEFQL